MALIEYMLENFNRPSDFEQLCCHLLLKSGYPDIIPISGPGDQGCDAVEKLYEHNKLGRYIVFQFSLNKKIKEKVLQTLERIKECQIKPDEIICVFNSKISPTLREELIANAFQTFGYNLDIRPQQYLTLRRTYNIFRTLKSR